MYPVFIGACVVLVVACIVGLLVVEFELKRNGTCRLDHLPNAAKYTHGTV